MRAGKLDTAIIIQAPANIVGDDGVIASTWSDLHAIRAEIIESGTTQYFRAYGATDEELTVFRIRYVAGLQTTHRIQCGGKTYRIQSFKEIRRKRGWEIRAVAI